MKKALSLLLALVMCLSLVPTAFAANQVTVTLDKYTVTFSDARVVENVQVSLDTGKHLGVSKLYYVAPNSTISIRNDSNDRSSQMEYAFIMEGVYVAPGSGQSYGYVKNGSITISAFSDDCLPILIGDTLVQTAESWLGSTANLYSEGPNVTGVLFSYSGSYTDKLADIYMTLDTEQSAQPTTPTAPAIDVENIPASGTAKASTQTVTVDGKKVEFQMYALVDANGNDTNYIKLRDMAYVLNDTSARFSVGYDSASNQISLTTGQAYAVSGSEMTTPYSGNRAYKGGAQTVKINGAEVAMTAITLTDDAGGDYNYFKLRDLGAALGFNVGYSDAQGVYIESNKPYQG